jgi:hypothetical protein
MHFHAKPTDESGIATNKRLSEGWAVMAVSGEKIIGIDLGTTNSVVSIMESV